VQDAFNDGFRMNEIWQTAYHNQYDQFVRGRYPMAYIELNPEAIKAIGANPTDVVGGVEQLWLDVRDGLSGRRRETGPDMVFGQIKGAEGPRRRNGSGGVGRTGRRSAVGGRFRSGEAGTDTRWRQTKISRALASTQYIRLWCWLSSSAHSTHVLVANATVATWPAMPMLPGTAQDAKATGISIAAIVDRRRKAERADVVGARGCREWRGLTTSRRDEKRRDLRKRGARNFDSH
jgi:hypothetical protein